MTKPTDTPKHYLYPSALFVKKEGHMVTTVLGSCVAVCLYDKVMGIGGINHYMLPFWNGNELASPKYGNIAIENPPRPPFSKGGLSTHLTPGVLVTC